MSVVVIGMGEMGGVFSHGFLRLGHAVHPALRGADLDALAEEVPEPEVVLVAVGEGDLPPLLARAPEPWRDRLVLLQNELLPEDWKRHGVVDPTVAVVWFEKKKGRAAHVVVPTVVTGPNARFVVRALETMDIPVRAGAPDRLLFDLVAKNLYILTANLAGLEVGGTVRELWSEHRDLARDVAAEVLALQAYRAGEPLPQKELVAAMVEAFDGDPDHKCMGRSAPARLRRALGQAKQAELHLPTLERLGERHL